MENSMSSLLVGTVVKKALRSIKEAPERCVRNLVDMALQFSAGRFQKRFFTAAQTMLQNENSGYYNLIRHSVVNADTDGSDVPRFDCGVIMAFPCNQIQMVKGPLQLSPCSSPLFQHSNNLLFPFVRYIQYSYHCRTHNNIGNKLKDKVQTDKEDDEVHSNRQSFCCRSSAHRVHKEHKAA